MPQSIEILSVGGNFDTLLGETAQFLNGVQDEFDFRLPPSRLRDFGSYLVEPLYQTRDLFAVLRKFRSEARGFRPYLIAIVDKRVDGEQWGNVFGSHEAREGLAVITLHDHELFAESPQLYLCYFLIRYALSFVCPELRNHDDTRGCFFDRKAKKSDLAHSLRSGRLCVECQEAFSPKLNREINNAIENMVKMMKALSKGSQEPIPSSALKGQVDVGIISIREDEFKAVLNRFPERRLVQGTGSDYRYTQVFTKMEETLRIAITRAPEQGETKAQAVASAMISDLAPKWIFLVGIAGGFAAAEYTLGDVLLSQRMHDFSVTAKAEGKPPTFQDMGGPMLVEVEKLIKDLRAEEAKLLGWNSTESIGQPKIIEPIPASVASDKLYGNSDWRESVIDSLASHFPVSTAPRNPEFFSGALITSNTLVKDTELVTIWRDTARSAMGVEMELAGVCAAARYLNGGGVRVLAIRGISDIIGYKRDPRWTGYACNSAAAFCHALIMSGLIRR